MVLRIFIMIATSDFLTPLPNSFSAGARPRTPMGGLQCSPDALAGLRGPTYKGREGKEKRVKGRGREGNGRERDGPAPYANFQDLPLN